MGRYKKPRVLAQFIIRGELVRVVDQTGTEYNPRITFEIERCSGVDAMGVSRWESDIAPRTFSYTQGGEARTLQYFSVEDAKQAIDALCRKLRARRRRSKKGGV